MMSRRKTTVAILLLGWLALPAVSLAQGVSLTVTPTIFEMSAVPQQAWSSQIKVVNNNPFAITVYADPVNFTPRGERGHSAFVPVLEQQETGQTLAEWMSVPNEPVTIPPEQSRNIPVQISVPADAAPGGHYAAVLIGTQPPDGEGQMAVQTSQLISSLFFLRIAGDVNESASIRTFRVLEPFSSEPLQTFQVRFENEGNVHLRPEGRIVITNMWGKERGVIPVNHRTNFGNVLPQSIREFEFTWEGENVVADFGRYTATLTLGYGSDQRQFLTRTIHFWVVPIKPLLIAFGVLVFLIWFIRRTINAYVRYMLRLSGIDPDAPVHVNASRTARVSMQGDVRIEKTSSVSKPVTVGWFDFKRVAVQASLSREWLASLWSYMNDYRIFFISFGVCVVLVIGIVQFFANVTTDSRDYEVRVDNGAGNTTVISSESQLTTEQQPTQNVKNESYIIEVVNASSEPGSAATIVDELRRQSYRVTDVRADLDTERDASVIVYHPNIQDDAVSVSELLGGVTVSVFNDAITSNGIPTMTIIVGNDLVDYERDTLE